MSIQKNQRGICPHCKTQNRFEVAIDNRNCEFGAVYLRYGLNDLLKELETCRCTNCGRVIIFFDNVMIHPLGATRPPCPEQVPTEIANDYNEACLVENLSKKAGAALARRCLQNLLHDQGIIKSNLNEEIDEAIKNLPTQLGGAIDSIRNIGNFAAHPIKSLHSGEILNVEDGEVEWSLDVLEQLFDFYFVAPDNLSKKRQILNKKLNEAGKPELK
ncbi:MAG: DUF4145 domain-containing protein [Patescibacteria group bacterium]|jgi:hypothetical protein